MTRYDYIIVGSGSAGSVLARRLSDADAGSVLLLEAGDHHTDNSAIHNPAEWATLWSTAVDWGYQTTPQVNTAGRVHDWPRGKVLGGTSCLNAMEYIRGHRTDFDAWAEAGNAGWDHASVLPYFIDLEDHEGGVSEHHGVGGPLHVSVLEDKDPNPVSRAFVEACVEAGFPRNDDLNGPALEGAGWNPTSIRDRVRQDTWTCFVAPITGRANLTVRAGAHVARVVLDAGRATGVELIGGERLHAEREVILCAGAIDSPRLLLQSGIGPADELRALGIDVVADLPGVGRNLHDHLLLGVVYEARQPVPLGVNNLSESVLFTHSSARSTSPDIQVALVHVPFHSAEFTAPVNSYTIAPGIVRPRSRGSLRLLDATPHGALAIDPNYLAEDEDVIGLLEGIAMAREIGGTAALADWRGSEVLPGPGAVSEPALREFVARAASTYYHPVGTCAMGHDASSVVDDRLRVRGVNGLRVADASIMPTIVSANPNAAITMIGAKAAVLISGVAPRPTAAAAVMA